MKRLVLLVLLVPVLLSSCFIFGPGYEPWNGELEGIEGLYEITVDQDSTVIVLKVKVNASVYNDVLISLENEGKIFMMPSELFIWMAPIFQQSNYLASAIPTMYPVASKKIDSTFFADRDDSDGNDNPEVEIRIDLQRLLRAWSVDWLNYDYFDLQNDDDMNGAYLFVSDNYVRLDEYYFNQTNIKVTKTNESKLFIFNKSRPAGLGDSKTSVIIGEDWELVYIAPTSGDTRYLFKTNFDDETLQLTGDIGGYLIKSTEYHDDLYNYPANEYNNWIVGPLPVSAPNNVSGYVLGLGSGNDISNNYDNYRHDTIEIPAYNYGNEFFDEYGGYNYAEVYIIFDIYKNLSDDYQDVVYLEIQDGEGWTPIGGYYNYWWGPNDIYYNFGWNRMMIRVDDYLFDRFQEQKIRLRFYSDGGNTSEGVYIDNLQVILVR